MDTSELKNLIDRWDKLFDKKWAFGKAFPEKSNVDMFFKQEIIGSDTYKLADEKLSNIEKEDATIKQDFESRKSKEEDSKIQKQIEEKLTSTTWSMLSDARLSQEGKKLYRNYRDYLRDIPDLWKRGQILKYEVMSFEDWRKAPPIYKLEKKVIL